MQDTALYIHWPYCAAKCPYCDFNSHVVASIDHERWRSAYQRAIAYYAAMLPDRRIVSIYFGGGTPSLMEPETVALIIDEVQRAWKISNDIEITLEANPTSVEIEKFEAFRGAGVNRVSLGVQALNDKDLAFLGRKHSADEAKHAIEISQATFDRTSFDLIYARPEQTLADWKKELREAASLSAGHLSLYQLTIERNTPFYMSHARGDFTIPEEGLAADFYDLTQDVLEGLSMPAYEVSNHARAGEESKHNLAYWHYGDYIGIGPGAHGRLSLNGGIKHATRDHAAPEKWLEWVEEKGCGAHPYEALSAQDSFMEALMMGLRLRDGISLNWQEYLDEEKLDVLKNEGWLHYDEEHLRLTRQGLLRLNAIVPYIMAD